MREISYNTLAYIDPSAVTYIIQVIAGIVIAIGAGVGILIAKVKNKIGIDNDKKKEVESDDI